MAAQSGAGGGRLGRGGVEGLDGPDVDGQPAHAREARPALVRGQRLAGRVEGQGGGPGVDRRAPGTRDSVRVGPPLPDGVVCRTDDTLAPVTMFPFVPFTKPPEPPPPIRLFLLAAVSTTSPDELSYAPMSLAPVRARCRARSS